MFSGEDVVIFHSTCEWYLYNQIPTISENLWDKKWHTHKYLVFCVKASHNVGREKDDAIYCECRERKDDAIPCCACYCTYTCCETHTIAVHARATKPWCTLFSSFHLQLAAAGVVSNLAWKYIRCAILLMQLYRSELVMNRTSYFVTSSIILTRV